VPPWGRPPGARLGRGQRAWAAQSWSEYDDRFEELETDDDGYQGVELDQGYRPKRFVSDELRFTGLDLGQARRRHSYEDSNSDDDGYDGSRVVARRGETQVMLREKEDDLVRRALERIQRARALGKNDVKLDPSELEALRRIGMIDGPPASPPALPKAAPKGKKTAPAKSKAAEVKKNGKKSGSNSPKPKAIEGRSRGRSTASSRSKSDKDEALVPYPISPEERYGYPPNYFARGSAPGSRQQSSARNNQSLRQQHAQSMLPYQHPYYQSRYYSNPDVYGPRPGSGSSRAPRPDPSDPDWEPRARSASNLVQVPLDQLPQAGGRAARFDPNDPRFASPPTRRIVSGPPAAQYRRPQDELFLPQSEEPEVMQYLTNSSHEDDDDEEENGDTTTSKDDDEDSDESGQGVQVNVEERPAGGYAIQTRAGARKGTGGSSSSKAAGTARRRK
jgi:PRA1 family protein 1